MRPLETTEEVGKTRRDNAACDLDFMEMSVPLQEIKTDGYKIGVTQHAIQQSKVNEIKETFNGINQKPIIIYSCDDGCYHVVKKQHFVEAIKELVNEGKIEPIKEITCDIIAIKSECEVMDANVPADRFRCFQYSKQSDANGSF